MTGTTLVGVNDDLSGEEAASRWGGLVMVLSINVNTCRQMAVYGPLVLDIENERASLPIGSVTLQQSDWAILAQLSKAGGAFVRSSDLLSNVWGDDMRDDTAFLRAWIHRLNDRLGACCGGKPVIDAIPGGYRLLSSIEWSLDLEYVAR